MDDCACEHGPSPELEVMENAPSGDLVFGAVWCMGCGHGWPSVAAYTRDTGRPLRLLGSLQPREGAEH